MKLWMAACVLVVTAAGSLWSAEFSPQQAQQALKRYVERPDPSYGWVKRREGRLGPGTYVELTLTSQTWRDLPWKHQLFLLRPASVSAEADHALLFVTGGSWSDELEQPPGEGDRLPGEANLFAVLAEQLRTPVAILRQVPRQPIFDGKYEDQIIAMTFARFLETGDVEWPLLLPMVKSAVRAMDATSEYCEQAWSLKIDSFTVSGASKRGWTTWLTGAVDKRATAIAPMVIDMLNMSPQLKHQRKTWGDLSYKIDDYTKLGLQDRIDTEGGKALQAIVDPFQYRSQLLQPKLIIIGTNDHYWPLDALNLYWEDLQGPKYILYVPNNRHDLKDYTRLIGSLNALHQHAAQGRELPDLKWSFQEQQGGLRLSMRSDIAPREVRAWLARSESRDFRGSEWSSEAMEQAADGSYGYRLPQPESGYAAVFGEAVYDGLPTPYYFSTNVRIHEAEK